ncbi:lysoplasmalogenase family protein [Flavobacterium sp.]|uniref:lysoplasmalogenase family protein n=1 Tax=Flavobacterium sp. TaxID=239 RepID=UPI0025F2EE20|nr:lysoplasmalogenase family protein [Flavobacterium sp.]
MANKINVIYKLTLCYFVIAIFEIIAEYFVNKSIICILKPLLPVFLIIIYYIDSERKNVMFIIVLLLSSLTNILFIPNTPTYLFYGIIVFTIHRIICIYLILSLQKFIDYIPIIIATSPFLLIFFYLFTETSEIPENSFYVIIIQNILISVLTGIALASYVMNDSKQNSILLISALLFVMLQFVVFVEKYFLTNEYQEFFRPTAMTLNALAFFSLYKYVVTSEKSNYNNRLS